MEQRCSGKAKEGRGGTRIVAASRRAMGRERP